MLFAVLYWNNEYSFDSFHKNNPNLYRITTTMVESKDDKAHTLGGTGQVQGPAFKEAVPEVKSYVRILGGDIYSDVIANNKTIHLRPLFVDENFFDVFSFHLLRGNATNVLSDIGSVVVTESTAKKFFNSIDVVGKLLHLDADPSYDKLGKPLMISGVVKDPPANSSLQFDALFTFKFLQLSFEDNNWLNSYLGTFVVLNPKADINAVAQKFNNVYASHAKEQLAQNSKTYGYDPQISYGLQPMTDIHLKPMMPAGGNAEGGIINGSNPVYAYMFMCIALFILLMAAINFINISIANSLKRAKEVGVRKIAGSSKWQIVAQFLNESAILCFLAFLLSLVLVNSALPLFNNLAGTQILLSEAFGARLLFYFILLLAIIILLTGFYPAFVLSNFKPSEVLYNKQKLSGRNLFGRSLVIVQFSLAVFLLIATIVYYSQMNYIRTKDLGYNPDQVIRTAVEGDRDYKSVITYLKNEFAKEHSIKTVSFANDGYSTDVQVNDHKFKAQYKHIDENFLAALEIPLKAGRNFSPSFSTDAKNGAIVNEAFVKAAGIQNPVGSTIKITGDENKTKLIAGVVKDFHFGSLREPIAPMVMYMTEVPDGGMWIRFNKAKQKEALAAIEKIYKAAMPSAVFQYAFLDELNAKQYIQEQRWKQVVSIAALLSLIICCLGLFGLAHLATNRRTKEIGIRKVLGASVARIIKLLSGDFLKLVIIAFVIAAPVSWFVMNKWLQNFAYRISIGPGIFVSAAAIAIVIALATVSFQAIKAAIANPVKSLRTE
jgi:putative ABC transport system permease protein